MYIRLILLDACDIESYVLHATSICVFQSKQSIIIQFPEFTPCFFLIALFDQVLHDAYLNIMSIGQEETRRQVGHH